MDIKQQKKIGIQYSVGQIATLVLELMAAYALFYMTTVKLIDATVASTLLSVPTLISAVLGLYIGYVADKSKKGKRFIAFMFLIPTLIAFCLFFAPVNLGDTGNTVYIAIMLLAFYSCYYGFLTPFDALGGEIVSDYNVRTFMRTLCVAGIYVGVIFADTLSTYIRAWLASAGLGEGSSWFVMALILAVVSGLAGLFAFKATKGHEHIREAAPEAEKTNIVKSYVELLKIRPIRVITLWTILYYVVCMIMSPMIIYYGVYVLGLSQMAASTLYMVAVAVTLIVTPFVPMIAKKTGKKGCLYISTVIYIIFAVYAMLGDHKGIVPGIFFAATYSIVNTIAQGCSYSMLYDAGEVAEFKIGKAQETSTMGLMKCAMSVGTALGTMTLGKILSLGHFDGAVAVQSQETVDWIVNGVSWIPAVVLIVTTLFIVVGYKINEKNHDALVKALEAKREGKEYSTEGFEELL